MSESSTLNDHLNRLTELASCSHPDDKREIHWAITKIEQLLATLQSDLRVMDGVGPWLLHRFGPNTPEAREAQLLLENAEAIRKLLSGDETPHNNKRLVHQAQGPVRGYTGHGSIHGAARGRALTDEEIIK